MFNTVELPIWALILICLLAAVTAASHLLFPSVRWFFRRRAERVVARLNKRLTRPIQPFKLARRHDMIQNVLYDPEVIRAVNDYAEKQGIPDNVAFDTAERYAREIVPSFSATVYFGFGIRVAKWLARSVYRVRLFNLNRAELDAIDDNATIVFIINHRSNMDYVLVTYLAAEDSTLSYAVGEWARVWPLRPIIKMMGGYFIRRKSLNPLYRKVLARYVQLSTKAGVAQAVFPEGGLSRKGSLGEPKLGLISYIIDGFEPKGSRDVVFVPIGLNYDRVLEDRVLVEAASGKVGRPFKFRMSTVFRYFGRHIFQRLSGRFHKLGYAGVSFGKPISLKGFMAENQGDIPTQLGIHLMGKVGTAVPVLPVPLVAHHILEAGTDGIDLDALTQAVENEVERLRGNDVEVYMPRAGIEKGVVDAALMLTARGLVEEDGTKYRITGRAPELLSYYASSISQFVTT
jgi:glycerol-3-phosphate O-acyltransferase